MNSDVQTAEEPALATRVRSAVIWRTGSQFLAQLLTWGATIIVVRMLTPGDYGLFAMSQVLMVALNFLNGHSFASSLIQEKETTKGRIAQVFGLILTMNVALAVAQWFAAPYIAAYFRQPIVEQLLHVQLLLYFLMPFIALPTILLARRLNFKAQAKVDLSGAVVGAIASLAGAYGGLGVWTLVLAPIVQQVVRAIGMTYSAKFNIFPSFNFRGIGSLITFGSALILCQFFWVIQSQSDIFIAGRILSKDNLGLYSEALFLTLLLTAKFVPSLNEVAFPAYTQLASDGGSVGYAFLRAARLLMFIAIPFYLGMSAVAEPFVALLLGPKWLGMIPLVSGLTLAMPFFALQIICSPTTNALGIPKIYILSNLAGAILFPIAFYIGSRSGEIGMVHAWQVAAPLLLCITLSLTLPVIQLSLGALLRAISPSIAAGIAMYAVVHAVAPMLTAMAPFVQLAILVPLGAAVYLGLSMMFNRSQIDELIGFAIKRDLTATPAA